MAVKISNLSLYRGDKVVLQQYQQQFSQSRSCITGANGSGKSSLLCAIAGILPYQSGTIHWRDSLISQAHADIAIASDAILLPEFASASDIILLTQKLWQLSWPQKLIDGFAFAPQLDTRCASLSTGNLKKLQLILAFMRQPALLLLDEANIALDTAAQQTLWQLIAGFDGDIIAASNEAGLYAARGFTLVALHEV
ncbi:ABC transporter ATP-binding protein [Rheinheimera nanhaiensis]|uniref:ABC transporter, ATP-binding protein n=1 Tax=Rheinheimera nanhaiensis E407-8 TaxID=562729 RepID=I1E057_9GAMM|nr:ATP-binding cassette domain-containing protein [Rheinheimera nanhaiensis]GAB59685.1 ABC transporter, ATP-binding protein [Rheinheimera nanhaiensis E407-8]